MLRFKNSYNALINMYRKCKKAEYISINSKYRKVFSNKSNLENENLLFAVSLTIEKRKKMGWLATPSRRLGPLQNLLPFILFFPFIYFRIFGNTKCRNRLHYCLLNYV